MGRRMATLRYKRRMVLPGEVMALLHDGTIHHLRPGQVAPGLVKYHWPFAAVGKSPYAFLLFLKDAKERGATMTAIREHHDRCAIDKFVTDSRAQLGLLPLPSTS